MKKLIFTIAAILFCSISFSQTSVNLEVISSAGDYFAPQGSNITLSWTMGEPMIETFAPQGGTVVLTQGFQQPSVITQPGKFTIDGYLTYDNIAKTPLANAKIILVNSDSKAHVDTVKTDSKGYYLFNNVINGPYTFLITAANAWGGSTPVDALTVNRKFVGLAKFKDALTSTVANVDNLNGINPVDALMINRRFVKLIKKFTISDWQFTNPSVAVSGANASQNISALCAGDVNADFKLTKSDENSITLQNNSVEFVNPGQEFNYPISVSRDLNAGAFGLVFLYPSQNIIVKEVNSNLPDMVYNVSDGEIRVAWSDGNNSGINLNANDPIITLKLIAANVTKENELQLSITNESIMSDNNSVNLTNEILYAPKIAFQTTSTGFYLGQNYPNPFRQSTSIDYSLPESAQVSLKVYNLVGEQVSEVINSWQEMGYHQVPFLSPGLAEGVYMYKMEAKGANAEYTKTRMMVVSQ